MTRSLAWLLCISFVAACSSRGTVSPAPPPAVSETAPTPVEASTSNPGLVIRGYVRLSDGAGLANVTICRSFAAYPASVIALTDQTGYYQAAFVSIPGDEMIGVWAQQAGYSFEPKMVGWRHYHGFEGRTLDFVAIPTSATDMPPTPCS